MTEEFEQIGKVREMHSLTVSSRGDGLCLYLPKKLCRLYGILAGDQIKVQLGEIYRRKHEEEKEDPRYTDEKGRDWLVHRDGTAERV